MRCAVKSTNLVGSRLDRGPRAHNESEVSVMLVKNAMTCGVTTVAPEETLQAAAQQMHMQMKYRLSRLRPGVDHQPITLA